MKTEDPLTAGTDGCQEEPSNKYIITIGILWWMTSYSYYWFVSTIFELINFFSIGKLGNKCNKIYDIINIIEW